MTSYSEQEKALASAVMADPSSSPEDRALARSRLKSGAYRPLTDDDFENLSEFELEMWVAITRKVRGEPPVDRDVTGARDFARQAEDHAAHLRDVAEALAHKRHAPPEIIPRCRRCEEFSDDALQDLRETEDTLDATQEIIVA